MPEEFQPLFSQNRKETLGKGTRTPLTPAASLEAARCQPRFDFSSCGDRVK